MKIIHTLNFNLERIKKSLSLIDLQAVGDKEKFERSLLNLHSEITKISDNYINSLKLKLLMPNF